MLIRRPAIWHRISVRRRPALCPAPIYLFTCAPTGGLGDNAKCVIRVCGSTPEVPAHEAIRALNIACWVQIRDAPIDLRLLGKRRRGGTKGRRLDETSILPSHRWSYPTYWRRVKLQVRGLNE